MPLDQENNASPALLIEPFGLGSTDFKLGWPMVIFFFFALAYTRTASKSTAAKSVTESTLTDVPDPSLNWVGQTHSRAAAWLA